VALKKLCGIADIELTVRFIVVLLFWSRESKNERWMLFSVETLSLRHAHLQFLVSFCVCVFALRARLSFSRFAISSLIPSLSLTLFCLCISLQVEERNLLSVGYKNFVGSRRASWRILSALEDKEKTKGRDENAAKITDYRSKVEEELEKICAEIIDMLKENLIPRMEKSESADAAETSVFYHKMSGDYYRYLSEFRASPGREEAGEKACESYEKATEIASGKNGLHPTHPTRLGLALNYSVFHYEISNDPTKACALARTAFDEAITDLDTLDDESYKDSTLIMQLLRDNLTLWTSELADEEGE